MTKEQLEKLRDERAKDYAEEIHTVAHYLDKDAALSSCTDFQLGADLFLEPLAECLAALSRAEDFMDLVASQIVVPPEMNFPERDAVKKALAKVSALLGEKK